MKRFHCLSFETMFDKTVHSPPIMQVQAEFECNLIDKHHKPTQITVPPKRKLRNGKYDYTMEC